MIDTEHWKQLRRSVFGEQSGLCEDCERAVPLELHHLTYQHPIRCSTDQKYGRPIGTWETPGDVVGLCRDCHHDRHRDMNGDFWRDPDEKEAQWATYWNEMEKD